MKILLTGATGFLGRRLFIDFIRNNHTVIITKRTDSNLEPLDSYLKETETWDVDALDISKIFSTHHDIDVIVHAATDYGHDDTIPTNPFWANEKFPMQLMELAIRYQVRLFVNMDTFFNSGKSNYNYLRAYTLSKRHFQEWGQYCGEVRKIAFVNLRLFHIYGPNDNANKFVPTIVKRCLASEIIDLTDGTHKRDFIYIDDVVAAVNLVVEKQSALGYYHYDIGSGSSLRIRDFIEIVNSLCSNNAILNFGVLPTRQNELLNSCADIKAISALGWKPCVDITQGLLATIDSLDVDKAVGSGKGI